MTAAARLLLAVLLTLPVLTAAWSQLETALFLAEFLGEGRWQPLSAVTQKPERRALGPALDLYADPALRRPPGLVLVHGLSPEGKDDLRLREAARLLARAGWAVAVPTVEGLTVLRLRPDDSRAVVGAVCALRAAGYRAAVLGVSLGAGPALLAASHSAVAGDVSAVLALGGYASAIELLRFTLTGSYAFESEHGRAAVHEEAIAQFARANRELVDAAGRRLVDNRDPAAFDRLAAELPPSTRELLDALSPGRAIAGLQAPLFLIHGRQDPAVPFTESRRLAAAARAANRPVRVAIVGALSHVEGARRAAGLAGLARLWATFYAFRRASGG
jgi:fermentation-respiration switch protein FrsA (DUF1100 family)